MENPKYLSQHGYALLLNEGIPRALKGKKLRLKNPMVLPLIFEFFFGPSNLRAEYNWMAIPAKYK